MGDVRIGVVGRVHVERYAQHAVICYRGPGQRASWRGIEFEGDEHTWADQVLKSAAATKLNLPATVAAEIEVLDFAGGFVPPDGFYN